MASGDAGRNGPVGVVEAGALELFAPGGHGILDSRPWRACVPAERQGVAIDAQRTYEFDAFRVDPAAFVLFRDGRQVHLEPRVLKLLVYLIEHRDRLVPRAELIETVWGDTVISDSALSKAVARLRKALGDDAGAPRCIETAHSLGYRFVAAVKAVEADGPSSRTDTPRARVARPRLIALFAVAVLAVASWLVFRPAESPPVPSPTPAIASLAVLPLGNLTGDAGRDAWVAGLHDMLTTEISQRSRLRVTSRQSTRRYGDSELPLGEIAGQLGVDALVEGSVLAAGGRVRLTAQLVDAHNDAHLWAETFEEDERDLLGLIATVADRIVAQLEPGAAPRSADAPPASSLDPAASRAFLVGLEELNRLEPGGFERAMEQFRAVVGLEPGFAPAWAEISAIHLLQAAYGAVPPGDAVPRARGAAEKALELDRRSSLAHSAMGFVLLWTGEAEAAAQAFRFALELNPSDSGALHGEADCLMLAGRLEESLEPLRMAQLVDPFTPLSNMPVPIHLYMLRRYEEAITEANAVNERIPSYSVHWLLARIYWQQGRFEEALAQERLEFDVRNDGVLRAALDRGYAQDGATGAMRAVAAALAARSAETYVDPFRVAIAHARAGAADGTLEWLGRAVANGSPKLTYLGFWPEFDFIRDEPRFVEIERAVGLTGR